MFADNASRSNIVILATGGTIAGQAASLSKSLEYTSGVLTGDALLDAVPGVAALANLQTEQLCNIGSEDMTETIWLDLAAAVNKHGSNPAVNGMIVLHGTDTMEETAFFLQLTANSAKPLILTGAMRPANAVSADGPANILDAVSLAASPDAAGKGVLICFNGGIFAAREVAKINSSNLAAFGAPPMGELGSMIEGRPHFYRSPTRPAGRFAIDGIEKLPRVEIIYGHAGQRRDLIDAAVAAGAKGIVHAGVGMGMVHRDALPGLVDAARKGLAVACSSRVGAGFVPTSEAILRDGFIAADNLNPQKARILMQLALTVTSDPKRIQEIFDTY